MINQKLNSLNSFDSVDTSLTVVKVSQFNTISPSAKRQNKDKTSSSL